MDDTGWTCVNMGELGTVQETIGWPSMRWIPSRMKAAAWVLFQHHSTTSLHRNIRITMSPFSPVGNMLLILRLCWGKTKNTSSHLTLVADLFDLQSAPMAKRSAKKALLRHIRMCDLHPACPSSTCCISRRASWKKTLVSDLKLEALF